MYYIEYSVINKRFPTQSLPVQNRCCHLEHRLSLRILRLITAVELFLTAVVKYDSENMSCLIVDK